jgi:hypothetical protein
MQANSEIAKEILNYFLRNANAADDLEGIARFRLLDQVIYRRVDEVSEALDWLVSVGLLNQTITSSTDPIFSLNETRREEAQELAEGRQSSLKRRRKKRPS